MSYKTLTLYREILFEQAAQKLAMTKNKLMELEREKKELQENELEIIEKIMKGQAAESAKILLPALAKEKVRICEQIDLFLSELVELQRGVEKALAKRKVVEKIRERVYIQCSQDQLRVFSNWQ